MHCRFAERPAVGGCGLSQLNSRRRVLPKPLILFTPMPEQADCSLIGTAPRPRATLRLVTRMLTLVANSRAGHAAIGRAAKREQRVLATGMPLCQSAILTRFTAAAVMTCCRWVLASPM